jgi:2-iminobutanoate/2-iminopropanoate deaminase
MPKEIVKTTGSVSGIPISAATKAGPFIFVSGQVGAVDDADNTIPGVEGQTRRLLTAIKKILQAAGASMEDVVKTTVFLVNADDFAAMNRVYQEFFTTEPPARSTIIVAALAKPEWLVEIEAIAYRS